MLVFGKDGIMFGVVGLWSCALGGTVGVGIGPELIWVGCGPLVVGKPVGVVTEPGGRGSPDALPGIGRV